MTTLWQTTTDNSTLPVQLGNNWWDHLHNQNAGGGGCVGGRADVDILAGFESVDINDAGEGVSITDNNETIAVQGSSEAIEI